MIPVDFKLTKEEFKKYVDYISLADFPTWRKGQIHFNILLRTFPDTANAVRGTSLDPFYDDTRIPRFLKEIQKEEYNDSLDAN